MPSNSGNEAEACVPSFCRAHTLVLGCGNVLFGDDGFGPAVIDHLKEDGDVPPDVYVMDVGTSIRKLLFTLVLSEERPERIIIIDAVDKEKTPGQIFQIPLDDLPPEKSEGFSLHQVPTSHMARELQDAGIEVEVFVCQTARIPDHISPGISDPVLDAIPKMSAMIAHRMRRPVQDRTGLSV